MSTVLTVKRLLPAVVRNCLFSQVWVFVAGWTIAQPPGTTTRTRPEIIQAWMKENKVPTVGIGYIEKAILTEVNVYGNRPANVPAPASTVFNVASLTKPVVAMLTLTLVSRGQWTLDEPLASWWTDPDVIRDPRHKRLTTRHVLSHQSGFVNWRWNHPTNKLTFDAEPGTRFGYSGEGYEYLKKALEMKFNQPLEQLADSVLFKPLGMKNTRFYWNGSADQTRFALEYDKEGKPYPARQRTDASAADDLLTTVGDYGRFGLAVLQGTGLSKSVMQDMQRPQTAVDSVHQIYWGLGWELITNLTNGEYALFHGGSDQGVRAMVVLLPISGRGLIILTNADGGQEVIRRVVEASLPEGKELIERMR